MNYNRVLNRLGSLAPGYSAIEYTMSYGVYHSYYKKRLKEVGIVDKDMLIIGTIARSGTHYIMMLLANYVSCFHGRKEGLTPSEMNDMFPNNWHLAYMNYHNIPFGPYNSSIVRPPDSRLGFLGLKEITRSHSIFQKVFWKNSRVLHLYRNPLDYSVSLYNYKHKKRPDTPNRLSSPSEVLEEKFDNYVDMYKSYVSAAKFGDYKILRVAYEELIRDPEFYLDAILRWIGIEPFELDIKNAVESSSIKRTKEFEKIGSVVNPTAFGLKGSFISSGVVGQWKNYYTDSDFAYWEKKFSEKGVDLNSFILD